MIFDNYDVLDISLPVSVDSAHFPGDTPFQREITMTYAESQVINLTAFTMSPHVGTHADAPIHVYGDMASREDTIGSLPLQPFMGPAYVVDVGPLKSEIPLAPVAEKLDRLEKFPTRVLFKTTRHERYDLFDPEYASFSVPLVEYLAAHKVTLVGIDTPSVDSANSKTLDAHHALLAGKLFWLENLDLTHAQEGEYVLIALPIKFMDLEASPIRAVLLREKP
jgi:arylformamidase